MGDVYFFLDTEFTGLHTKKPELLSMALLAADGRSCYVELDLCSDLGRQRLANMPKDVREIVIRDRFGLIPDSIRDRDSYLGHDVGEWLLWIADYDPEDLDSHAISTSRVYICFDFDAEWRVFVGALQAAGLWAGIAKVVVPVNIAHQVGDAGAEIAAARTYHRLSRWSSKYLRHHALAYAHALRAAHRMWTMEHKRADEFAALMAAWSGSHSSLCEWLSSEAAFSRVVPLDMLEYPDGFQEVPDAVLRLACGDC